MRISPAAVPSFAQHDLLPILDDFRDGFTRRLVDDHGPKRKADNPVGAVLAKLIRAHPVAAALCAPVRLVFVIDQIVRVVIPHQDHITAPAAVTSVRTAPRLVFFPAEAHATATAVTGLKFHYALINEHSVNDAERAAFAKGRIASDSIPEHRVQLLTSRRPPAPP